MTMTTNREYAQFEDTMVPFMDVLYNYAYYLCGEREQAKDLLQETYLKAFRFFDKFEQGTNAKAWLYRIMRNTYINEYRRVKRIPELVEYDEQVSPYRMFSHTNVHTNDLRDMIDAGTFDDDVAIAISSLPEKFKSVVVLRDVEDLPYEEIAETLQIPVGTVRSRLHRARAILFEKLKEYAKSRGYAAGDRFSGEAYALAI